MFIFSKLFFQPPGSFFGHLLIEIPYFISDKLLQLFLRNNKFVLSHTDWLCKTFESQLNLSIVLLGT